MVVSASSEFLLLCQSQLRLLAQSVGASLSVLYVPEGWLDAAAANLIPIAVYPEAATSTVNALPARLASQRTTASESAVVRGRRKHRRRSPPVLPLLGDSVLSETLPMALPGEFSPSAESGGEPPGRVGVQQAVQPLFYDNRPLGLLVIAREGKEWSDQDYTRLEEVAKTLAAACMMEQRLQWWQDRLRQQEILQERQQDLLDNLVHQFRNPLTALRTFGKLLLKRLQPGDANREVVEGIVRESDRLQTLLQQINETVDDWTLLAADASEGSLTAALVVAPEVALGVAPAVAPVVMPAVGSATATEPAMVAGVAVGVAGSETMALLPPGRTNPLGRQMVQLAPCALPEILQPLVQSFAAIAQEQQQRFSADWAADLPWVYGNAAALTEVVGNLVENALKYTPAQGTVRLSVQRCLGATDGLDPAWLDVWVSDDGPGIPVQDLPHVFERHYRGVQAAGPKAGTGLGLAIVAALVGQMGGQLQVCSPAGEHKPQGSKSDRPGTAFCLRLRVAAIDKPLGNLGF